MHALSSFTLFSLIQKTLSTVCFLFSALLSFTHTLRLSSETELDTSLLKPPLQCTWFFSYCITTMLSIFHRLHFFFSLTNFWQMFYCLWRSWQRGIVVYLDGLYPRQAGSNLQQCPGRLMPNTHGEANCHRHTTHDTVPFIAWPARPARITKTLFSHLILFSCS